MVRSPIHPSIFILIALFLAACGSRQTPLPSAIVLTDAPTRTALPTTTATPSPGLFTAIHSQITYVPTRTPTPTKTHTLTPTTTPTFVPTLPPATVATGPEGYQLKTWTEQDALDLVSLMRQQIIEIDDVALCCEGWSFASYDVLARSIREALLQFPESAQREALEWELARALIRSRHVEASFWVINLLEHALNDERYSLDKLGLLISQHGLGKAQLTYEADLFGAHQSGYILTIIGATGATFSISVTNADYYKIEVIDNLWGEVFVDEYSISIDDHTIDGQPEIAVSYAAQHGIGPVFAEFGVTVYQWQNDRWENLTAGLSNTYVSGWGSWEYSPTIPGQADNLIVISGNDGSMYPVGIPWKKIYTFYWDGTRYRDNHIQIVLPDRALDVFEIISFSSVWDWAEAENAYSALIPTLEATLANWPDATTEIWQPGISTTFEVFAGPAYRDYFQFQLGRMYALTGDSEKAASHLRSVANEPDAAEYLLVPEMARTFLSHLDQPEAADEAVIQLLETFSPCSAECSGLTNSFMQYDHFRALQSAVPTPTLAPATLYPWQLFDITSEIYFSDQDQAQLIPLLQSTFSDPTLSCDDDCSYLLYLLGLAHELSSHEREAVQAYWQLWHDYPDSPYTLMARRKLEVITP